MNLFLEILSGEQKGTRIQIHDRLLIGRRQGDLTIRDPKVSSRHAEVQARADEWYLVDLGSANAIKVGPDRLRELPLYSGTVFVLGRTLFRVVEEKDADAVPDASALQLASPEAQPPAVESPALDKSAHSFIEEVVDLAPQSSRDDAEDGFIFEPEAPPSWRTKVSALICRAGAASLPRASVVPFRSPVGLRVLSGLQAGTEWTLGYGPRAVGSRSTDLSIEDAGTPEVCFRISPRGDDVLFETEHAPLVRLNNRMTESELLRDGDIIQIRDTRIEVRLESSNARD